MTWCGLMNGEEKMFDHASLFDNTTLKANEMICLQEHQIHFSPGSNYIVLALTRIGQY